MLKMLTEYITGNVISNHQQTLKVKYLKAKYFLKLVGTLTCASIIAAEYFIMLVALRYLNENLGISGDTAYLLISLFFFLQAFVLFSFLLEKLKNFESSWKDHSSFKKAVSSFVSGFKDGS